jgi:hypothetical protein
LHTYFRAAIGNDDGVFRFWACASRGEGVGCRQKMEEKLSAALVLEEIPPISAAMHSNSQHSN